MREEGSKRERVQLSLRREKEECQRGLKSGLMAFSTVVQEDRAQVKRKSIRLEQMPVKKE